MPSVIDVARELIRAEARAVEAVADQVGAEFELCVRHILDSPGRVVTCGSGTSGAVAIRMAHLLSVCGTPAFFLHPADALHGSLGAVVSGDVLLAVSKGGISQEVNDTCVRAQQLGAKVIAVTADADSPLARLADHAVVLHTPIDADPGGLVAMGSTVAISAWSDALALVLMRLRGYSWTDVLFTHPSGKVGQVVAAPPALEAIDLPARSGQTIR